jgi:hypothetical protein
MSKDLQGADVTIEIYHRQLSDKVIELGKFQQEYDTLKEAYRLACEDIRYRYQLQGYGETPVKYWMDIFLKQAQGQEATTTNDKEA